MKNEWPDDYVPNPIMKGPPPTLERPVTASEGPKRIVVERISGGYRASLFGDKSVLGVGNSESSAIGNLMKNNQETFNIQIRII